MGKSKVRVNGKKVGGATVTTASGTTVSAGGRIVLGNGTVIDNKAGGTITYSDGDLHIKS